MIMNKISTILVFFICFLNKILCNLLQFEYNTTTRYSYHSLSFIHFNLTNTKTHSQYCNNKICYVMSIMLPTLFTFKSFIKIIKKKTEKQLLWKNSISHSLRKFATIFICICFRNLNLIFFFLFQIKIKTRK